MATIREDETMGDILMTVNLSYYFQNTLLLHMCVIAMSAMLFMCVLLCPDLFRANLQLSSEPLDLCNKSKKVKEIKRQMMTTVKMKYLINNNNNNISVFHPRLPGSELILNDLRMSSY